MENITYSADKNISAKELAYIFDEAGLERPTNDLSRMKSMIEHADVIVIARKDKKIIGVARALTDFRYCCYLSDLAVIKSYQKQGVGKKIVEKLQSFLGEEVSLLLISVPEAVDYYPKIGFDQIDRAFWIQRTK
ncbi:MAG: hypothetical protein HeimC3_42120 [Candidatus Heimdallarchaeota archaeon LC_3]|nr:MAG: hypothetical protein HeimC3_42120 [Candidatus Heimdallarchaeota archaeon LC_3]